MDDTRWTPTPWEAIGKAVYAADGTEVVHACKGEDPEANAARIIRAVNSHDDLCEALEPFAASEPAVGIPVPMRDGETGELQYSVLCPGDFEKAHAALAKARGEEETDA